jgi:hypothetical protein
VLARPPWCRADASAKLPVPPGASAPRAGLARPVFAAEVPAGLPALVPQELPLDALAERTRPFFAAPYLSFYDSVLVDPRSFDTHYSLNNITFSD